MEPDFNPARDALWKLDLVNGHVQVSEDAWVRRGDVSRWLESDVFDLGLARSRDAETAILDDADDAPGGERRAHRRQPVNQAPHGSGFRRRAGSRRFAETESVRR
jgi:hypothetical protein